jgi:hypothetical protein
MGHGTEQAPGSCEERRVKGRWRTGPDRYRSPGLFNDKPEDIAALVRLRGLRAARLGAEGAAHRG